MNKKVENGQFFTTTSPFNHKLFYKWYNLINDIGEQTIIEPFSGSNNIIKMIRDLDIEQPKSWVSFDIEPPADNVVPEILVGKRNTIDDFPKGYKIAITNPPYLAKNSATRNGVPFPDLNFDDLYKAALSVMLENLEYVAAIVPESFITQTKFIDRLYGFVSLNTKMFEDTEAPVGLALFTPGIKDNYELYRGDDFIGYSSEIKKELDLFNLNPDTVKQKWKFNDPVGDVGLSVIDNTYTDSIKFVIGSTIDGDKVKSTSRSITRISGATFENQEDLANFIDICNKLLSRYRENTQDVFMSSFMGLRADGKYRRRLNFTDARILLNKAYEKFLDDNPAI